MQRILAILSGILIPYCGLSQQSDCTQFPTAPCKDYHVKGYQAKLGIPSPQQSTRVWVKGSANFNQYKITDAISGSVLFPVTELTAPNYTAIFETNVADVKAEFGHDGLFTDADCIRLAQGAAPKTGDTFSILFYGCFDPFSVGRKRSARVNKGFKDDNYVMRWLFNKVALGQPVNNQLYRRGTDYRYHCSTSVSSNTILAPVAAVLGTGDQVYADAGYDNYKKKKANPISVWEVGEKPNPKVPIECYTEHMSRMYQHFGSFEKLNEVFHQVPSFSIWDDHEIRDGWGSQGDEYINSVMDCKLAPFYTASRKAYIDHQWVLGNGRISEVYDTNTSLHQQLSINGKRCFVFDLRSNRDINQKNVISEKQMLDFQQFLFGTANNEEILIVSSIPIFLGYKQIAYKGANLMKELKDDMNDGWESEENSLQRDSIVSLLLQARMRNVKPYIISGDVHSGAVLEVWYNEVNKDEQCVKTIRETRKILAYEIIASGLNHETLNQKKKTSFSSRLKEYFWSQRSDEDLIKALKFQGKQYTISNVSRIDKACLNFSAMEFSPAMTKIHLFLHSRSYKNVIEEFIIHPEWDKKDSDDRQFMGNPRINCDGAKYGSPLSQEKRNICLPTNDE